MTRPQTPPGTARPPRYKQAVITWLGAYPVLTAILALLGPAVQSWPLPLRTLLVRMLTVAALYWLVIPLLTRIFRGWLFRSK